MLLLSILQSLLVCLFVIHLFFLLFQQFVDLTIFEVNVRSAIETGNSCVSVADGDTSEALEFPHVTLPILQDQTRNMKSTTTRGLLLTFRPSENQQVSIKYQEIPEPGKLYIVLLTVQTNVTRLLVSWSSLTVNLGQSIPLSQSSNSQPMNADSA